MKKGRNKIDKLTLIKQDWYLHLVEECSAIVTEAVFNSRWALIIGYHTLGKELRAVKEYPITDLLQRLAVDSGISKRSLWYAVQFIDKYPDLGMLPEGKNLSWHKITHKYLDKHEDKDEPKREREQTSDSMADSHGVKKWLEYVDNSPCLLHPDRPSEGHHFPRTRATGAEDWQKIPLCRQCHTEAHADSFNWLWDNRTKIFDYFYNFIKED